MRTIPTIRTAQLTLRAMRPQDFDRYAQIWTGGCAPRAGHARARQSDAVWEAFLLNAGHWHMTGFGHWAVEPHGTPRMMGQVGFFLGRDRVDEDADPCPEAAWLLHPEANGMGLGQDAAQAAHDWFDRVITGPLMCKIDVDNPRSQQIARALGYAPTREMSRNGRAFQVMSRRSPPAP
ncbi:MAG: GNAT family N-acetyltransferase [Pseudomonadota bacterium]